MHQTLEVQSDRMETDVHEYLKMYKTSEFPLLAGDDEPQMDEVVQMTTVGMGGWVVQDSRVVTAFMEMRTGADSRHKTNYCCSSQQSFFCC